MKWLSVVAAVVLVVLVMHPGGGSTLDIFPLVSCSPDCTGVANGGKVPDPFNCTNFYYCMNGLPTNHPSSCDTGNEFDPVTGDCVGSYGCKSPCAAGGSDCPLSCNGTLSFIADVTDCSAYYICTPSGTDGPYKCPLDRPNFDGVDCVNDASVCCTGYCDPGCDGSGEFAFIPDPTDCTMFYVCDTDTAEGPPDDDKHFTCPSGQIFDVATLQCVAGDANSCVTLCDAAGGNGGGGGGGGSTPGSGGGSSTPGSGGGGSTTPGSGGGSSTASGSSSTGSSSGCVGSLTCPAAGYYAACDTCQPQYFDCSAAGAAGVLTACPGDTVFNPNPDYPICVLEINCPYP